MCDFVLTGHSIIQILPEISCEGLGKDDLVTLLEKTQQLMQSEYDRLNAETRQAHTKSNWAPKLSQKSQKSEKWTKKVKNEPKKPKMKRKKQLNYTFLLSMAPTFIIIIENQQLIKIPFI